MPAHLRNTIFAFAAAALAACGNPPSADPAPLDRFNAPIALGISGSDLLVVSSNFELAYALDDGGSVIPVDVQASPALGKGVRIASFAGELAIADATACGLPETLALVPAREGNSLYRIRVGPGGALSCGEGCRLPLRSDVADAYGVLAVCRPPATAGGEPRARAYVGFVRTPANRGQISEIDLRTGASRNRDVGLGPVRSFAYDAQNDRLYFTAIESGVTAPLRWIDLAGDCAIDVSVPEGGCPVSGIDLAAYVRGVEARGIALSNPQVGRTRRAFVAARVYNADLAGSIGGRPGFDVGGVLLVLDLVEDRSGLQPRLAGVFDVGLGANEVKVLPARPGKGDLVAVTASDDGLLWIYDDDQGSLVRVFGRDPHTGIPLFGRQPFGLAARDDGASARLFVSSFKDGFVTPVDVPLDAPWSAADPRAEDRIGVTP
ncbi:YncE family protein [Anaeromyxobacter terrae]|uniref:hypothetical protein n=1 Tax=Anaeromyxobacter terrae TaxID=2925406 RepID=UPI001F56532B|nr:hypothetical protein [Anaeromyxobacter sp. SG22]